MNATPLLIAIAFICFDVLTGWLKAYITATLNSSIMRTGLLRKIGEILAELFGYMCQYSLPLMDWKLMCLLLELLQRTLC